MSGYWNIPEEINTRTPLAVFREQASALTEATEGDLVGDISIRSLKQDASLNVISLSIKVPSLNNYEYLIMRYTQPILLYPGMLYDAVSDVRYDIDDETSFEDKVKYIIQSPQVSKVIVALIAQVRSMS